MDYKEKLQHYAHNQIDDISDEMLLDEAIATLENLFDGLEEHQLLHRSRAEAIAYLALRYIRDSQ